MPPQGQCLLCEAPVHEAPDLMGWSLDKKSCLFRKQPANAAELGQAISAMNVSCIQALRYSGNDPAILQKLKELALGHCCDAITNLKKE